MLMMALLWARQLPWQRDGGCGWPQHQQVRDCGLPCCAAPPGGWGWGQQGMTGVVLGSTAAQARGSNRSQPGLAVFAAAARPPSFPPRQLSRGRAMAAARSGGAVARWRWYPWPAALCLWVDLNEASLLACACQGSGGVCQGQCSATGRARSPLVPCNPPRPSQPDSSLVTSLGATGRGICGSDVSPFADAASSHAPCSSLKFVATLHIGVHGRACTPVLLWAGASSSAERGAAGGPGVWQLSAVVRVDW